MQRAMKRLSPKESYDRVYRMRRAFQVLKSEHGEIADCSDNTCSARLHTSCSPRRNGLSQRRYYHPSQPPNPPTQRPIHERPRSAKGILLTYTAQDVPYISPIIKELEAEKTERQDLETMVIKKPNTQR